MKTIEEAAKENYPECDNPAENKFREALRCGFYAGVEFAQRWISVDEEFPEKGSRVLLKNENGYVEIRTMEVNSISNGKLRNTIGGHSVTHWRYIEVK